NAPRNVVSGSLISGNGGNGVWILGSAGNTLSDNVIGLNASGTTALPNFGSGVDIADSPNNVLLRNVISGNGDPTVTYKVADPYPTSPTDTLKLDPSQQPAQRELSNVYIEGSGSTGNVVQGNFLGTDVTGTKDATPDHATPGRPALTAAGVTIINASS